MPKRKDAADAVAVVYLGLDGEGRDVPLSPSEQALAKGRREKHVYTFLALSDRTGKHRFSIHNPNGLTTVECLTFLLSVPRTIEGKQVKIFGFSLGYDWTKILTDVDDESLYLLPRTELRSRRGEEAKHGPWPVEWGGFELNMQGTKVVLRDRRPRGPLDPKPHRLVLWDVFKFYSMGFVKSIRAWKVGSPEVWDRIQRMKEKRAEFATLTEAEVQDYCFEECALLAELVEKLVTAAHAAGIPLSVFYGAGSLAAGMLKLMGIREKRRDPPSIMRRAVACAFFGGRFENSVIGEIREPCLNFDISSAYPYQTCFLPCLEHSVWQHTTREACLDHHDVRAALVHYGLGEPREEERSWGPFPFRTREGSIAFPIRSGGGWVWGAEYKAGRNAFPHVRFREAWILRGHCNCQPFFMVPRWYIERLKLGKEGPGLILKLGMNSIYGKVAQSIGNAIFQSWVWAGLITSGCRAQFLDVLALHKDRSRLLMVATDGIYTTENIRTPIALDTKTAEMGKPLGGWERKEVPKGIFAARPGIYFPLDPKEKEKDDVKGRGVGKSIVLDYHKLITEAWNRDGLQGVAVVPNLRRFCGFKTSIGRTLLKDKEGNIRGWKYRRADGGKKMHKELDEHGVPEWHDAPAYGEWVERRVELRFDPKPKRDGVHRDGKSLILRRFDTSIESEPYENARKDEEGLEMFLSAEEALEQPDGELMAW